LSDYPLEDLWNSGRNNFSGFAQNVLDKRLQAQDTIIGSSFAQFLRNDLHSSDIQKLIADSVLKAQKSLDRYRSNERYSEWLRLVDKGIDQHPTLETLIDVHTTGILIARDLAKKQLTLDLSIALSSEEIEERDSSNVRAASELFAANESALPYYYGIDRVCAAATNNIEQLLAIAADLYDGIRTKLLRRNRDLQLSPIEQDKLFKDVAKRKRDFIPRNHTEGTRAQRLLDAMGSVCREKTFMPNAPYAPGITGLRLSIYELNRLDTKNSLECYVTKRVLSECVAENLLVIRQSSASSGREAGTVFYLSRMLCVHYGLPFQYGGWQDATIDEFYEWMERGRTPRRQREGL